MSKLEADEDLDRNRKSDPHGWTLQFSDHFAPGHTARSEDGTEDIESTP